MLSTVCLWSTWLFCFFLVWKVKSLSCVWLFATPWTVAYQAPPSTGFSRQEYWSGLPFPWIGINFISIWKTNCTSTIIYIGTSWKLYLQFLSSMFWTHINQDFILTIPIKMLLTRMWVPSSSLNTSTEVSQSSSYLTHLTADHSHVFEALTDFLQVSSYLTYWLFLFPGFSSTLSHAPGSNPWVTFLVYLLLFPLVTLQAKSHG